VSAIAAQVLLKRNEHPFDDLSEAENIEELNAISNETIDIAKERSRKSDQEKL